MYTHIIDEVITQLWDSIPIENTSSVWGAFTFVCDQCVLLFFLFVERNVCNCIAYGIYLLVLVYKRKVTHPQTVYARNSNMKRTECGGHMQQPYGMKRAPIYVHVLIQSFKCYVQENVNTFYHRNKTPPFTSLTLFFASFHRAAFSLLKIGARFINLDKKIEQKNVSIWMYIYRNEAGVFFFFAWPFHSSNVKVFTLFSFRYLRYSGENGKLLTVRISRNVFKHLIMQIVFSSSFFFFSVSYFDSLKKKRMKKYQNWVG